MNLSSGPTVPASKPNEGFRLLHTSDWHLGKLLGDHSREEEHRRFLAFLLEAINEYSIDALVIAGDVFDSANPPQSAVAQYYNFLSSLYRQSDCSVVVVAGNHDSPAHLEAPRQVLAALRTHIRGSWPVNPVDSLVPLPTAQSPQVIVAAVPFLRDRDLRIGQSGQNVKAIEQELVDGIRKRYDEVTEAAQSRIQSGVPLLATGHLTVTGSKKCESEREIHVGGLGAISVNCLSETFAYVGLGHLHRPQCISGRETVRYSGSPIPLSFSEAGDSKELRILDFADGKLVQQAALGVPLSRRLAQIRTNRAALESDLKAFQPGVGDLPAWVEVVLEDPVEGENPYELAQKLAEDREFEIIRVVGKSTGSREPVNGGDTFIEGIERSLGDPSQVFARRLEEEQGLKAEEREALKTAFKELHNLYEEKQPGGTVKPAGAACLTGGTA